MYDDLNYRVIRGRAEAEVQRQKMRLHLSLFLGNLFLFIAFMVVSWGLTFSRQNYTEFMLNALLFVSVGWAVGLLFHGTSAWMATRGERRIRDWAMAQEVARAVAQRGLDDMDAPEWAESNEWREKAKRGEPLWQDEERLIDLLDDEAVSKGQPR